MTCSPPVAARSPLQTIVRVLVLAVSAALLGAMVLFVGHSLRTMTGAPCAPCRSTGRDRGLCGLGATLAARSRARPGDSHGLAGCDRAVRRGADSGCRRRDPGGQRGDPGAAAALSAGVLAVRLLTGRVRTGRWCSTSSSRRRCRRRSATSSRSCHGGGAKPCACRSAASRSSARPTRIFQPLDPLTGPGPSQPPSNVVVMPFATFVERIAPQLRPSGRPRSPRSPGLSEACRGKWTSQVDPAALTGSPRHAYDLSNRLRNREESRLPARVRFVDNLSDSLATAAGDALYAEALYMMLAVPGALIGLGLAYLAALGTVERDRRELSCCALGAQLEASSSARGDRDASRAGRGGLPARSFVVVTRAVVSGPLTAGARVVAACGRSRVPRCVPGAASPPAVGVGRRARRCVPLWQRLYLDSSRSRQRSRLLADRPNWVLGRGQPRLEPDAVAVGLHVLRARAAVDRRDAPARPPARPSPRLGRRPRRRAAAGRAASCSRAPADAGGDQRGLVSSGCCSRSASTSGSSRPPRTSRRASTRS